MSYSKIHNALDTQLITVTSVPLIQHENTRHVNKTSETYLRSTLLPAESIARTNVIDEYNGLYQVDIFSPQDKGHAAESIVDDIIAKFKRGQMLVVSNTPDPDLIVHIRQSWRETAFRVGAQYQIPVVIRWSSLIEI